MAWITIPCHRAISIVSIGSIGADGKLHPLPMKAPIMADAPVRGVDGFVVIKTDRLGQVLFMSVHPVEADAEGDAREWLKRGWGCMAAVVPVRGSDGFIVIKTDRLGQSTLSVHAVEADAEGDAREWLKTGRGGTAAVVPGKLFKAN